RLSATACRKIMGLGRSVVAHLTSGPSNPSPTAFAERHALPRSRGRAPSTTPCRQGARCSRRSGLAPCRRGQLSVSTNPSRVRGNVVKARSVLSAPNRVGKLNHHSELCPLFLFGQHVAFLRGGKTALR